VWTLFTCPRLAALHRRAVTPTGTNLLGLVKHQAGGELIYFGDVFGRPHGERLPWLEDGAGQDAAMWATPDETRDSITGLYQRARKHAAGARRRHHHGAAA
jgi:hypothetical protein